MSNLCHSLCKVSLYKSHSFIIIKFSRNFEVLSEEKQEAMTLRDKIQEQEETITELENKLKERNETWQTDKKKLTSDIKLLKNEVSFHMRLSEFFMEDDMSCELYLQVIKKHSNELAKCLIAKTICKIIFLRKR